MIHPPLPVSLQVRRNKSIAAFKNHQQAAAGGNPPPTQLEDIQDFHTPYNHFFW
jgi:hypothetical protein